MTNTEHTRLEQSLDEYVDGTLPPAERTKLEAHLSSCDRCRRERETLERLHGLLGASRVAVRPGFAEHVMVSAAKEKPAVRRPLWLAVGLVGLLALVSAVLFGVVRGGGGGLELVLTLADFATSTLLAGAGLLSASWRAAGLAVEEWLLASVPNLLGSLVLIVALNALAFRLVRSRRSAAARERHAGRRH